MDGISERDVADRAGVDRAYLTKLLDVGVLAPGADGTFTEGDVRRARLYQGLDAQVCRSRRSARRSTRVSSRSGGSTTRSTT